MRVVLALDSYKGTLTATEACDIVKRAVLEVAPATEVILKPMADGGEGTASAMISARNGEWIEKRTMGPLESMQVDAGYARFAEDREALVEMDVASGLPLLNDNERNPLRTTTYGTGQLLSDAFSISDIERVLLAVGGSATVDGGVGAGMALGWRFLDARGQPIGLGGHALADIVEIVPPKDMNWPRVEVLCDVDNPLLGPEGAAPVFGPQKGASPDMVKHLEKGLENLAKRVSDCLGTDISSTPGGGAAGGLSAGAMAFMNAELVPGIDTVMAASGLTEAVEGADWVITGEGKFDGQSLRGKVVSGVTRIAESTSANVAVIAGCVHLKPEDVLPPTIKVVKSTQKEGMSLEEGIRRSPELLREAAIEFAREWLS